MIRYLILDDEPIAHEIIEEYAGNFPQLYLAKNCYNVFQATDYLNSLEVDLIFLDINMPKISGFEFLKSLINPPAVIVTTAYKDYAMEGYELDVVDYLLKPFSLNRFMKAVNKVARGQSKKEVLHHENPKEAKMLLKDGKKIHQVSISSILFIEAFGNYTKVITDQKIIVTLEKLSAYVKRMPKEEFVQVHKSYIVALSHIDVIENNKVLIGDSKIPIGITYKHQFLEKMNLK